MFIDRHRRENPRCELRTRFISFVKSEASACNAFAPCLGRYDPLLSADLARSRNDIEMISLQDRKHIVGLRSARRPEIDRFARGERHFERARHADVEGDVATFQRSRQLVFRSLDQHVIVAMIGDPKIRHKQRTSAEPGTRTMLAEKVPKQIQQSLIQSGVHPDIPVRRVSIQSRR